jgi:hypothetical protein
VSIRRETADDDRERTQNLMAMLGNSLDPDRETDAFEQVIATSLYANDSTRPPAGHTYPRRG